MQSKNIKTHQELPTKILPFIWHFAKEYKGILLIMIFIGILGALFMDTILPYTLKIIVDSINKNNDKNLFNVIKIPLIFYICSWISMFILWGMTDNILYIKSISKIQNNIRNSIFKYLQEHSYAYFQNRFSGKISTKINDVANSVRNILQDVLTNIIPIFFALTFLSIALFTINPIFTYVIISWSIFFITFVTYISRKVTTYSKKWSDLKSSFLGDVIDSITNILSVKNFANSKFEREKIAQSTDNIYKAEKNMFDFKLKVRFLKDILGLSFLAINLFISAKLKTKNIITIGDFIFVLNTSTHMMWVIKWISQIIANLLEQIGICKQGLEIITVPHSIVDKPNAKDIKIKSGKIAFKNVFFGYSKDKRIFKNLNLTIKPKQKIGLVGFSGAGKSTFINLITRYFDINSGKILIDGQNIRKVKQESLQNQISIIPQNPNLFHRSILENIKYGKLDATQEEVVEASKKANCYNFIMNLPNQFKTLVGERGVKLSGGQRQRIAIARVILKKSPILILDEATSSLDSVTEKSIQNSMEKLMKNKTVIAIAHRLSTLQNMDRILVFEEGKIIEDGSHKSLLRKKGAYYKLWNMQINGFIPEPEEEEEVK